MIKPGLYSERSLLGAKVKIISSPAFELFLESSNDKVYQIQSIEYRVDMDGQFRIGITLVGLPNRKYSPEDLRIIEISDCFNNNKEDGKENQED